MTGVAGQAGDGLIQHRLAFDRSRCGKSSSRLS